MKPEHKRSFVRVKVFPALITFYLGLIYSSFHYVVGGYRVEAMSIVQAGAFFVALAAVVYVHNVRCERCKSKWNHTGNDPYPEPKSMKDHVNKILSEANLKMYQKCKVCELERY